MKTTITKIDCDVCNSGENVQEDVSVQVVFTTEQTEGRSIKPYLSIQKIDICDQCMTQILSGNMLFGSGAMGYNRYYFEAR